MHWLLAFVIELIVETLARGVLGKMLGKLKSRQLEKVRNRMLVEVSSKGHSVQVGTPEKNILFHLVFTKTYPMVISIAKIDYEILYDFKTIQSGICNYQKKMEREEVRDNMYLRYNPAESPHGIPQRPDRWGIKGTVALVSVYGTISMTFASESYLTVSYDGNWEALRGEANAAS